MRLPMMDVTDGEISTLPLGREALAGSIPPTTAHRDAHVVASPAMNREIRGAPIWGWVFAIVFLGFVIGASVAYAMDGNSPCDNKYGTAYDRCVESGDRWP